MVSNIKNLVQFFFFSSANKETYDLNLGESDERIENGLVRVRGWRVILKARDRKRDREQRSTKKKRVKIDKEICS